MREILPGKLWLGTVADGRDLRRMMAAGILAVVDLAAEELSPTLARSTVYCRFPILDGAQDSKTVLRAAIETVVSLLSKGISTLVYCGAGMSRSPSVVAAALSVLDGGNLDDRLSQVTSGHPHDISPALWHEIVDLCAEIRQSQ